MRSTIFMVLVLAVSGCAFLNPLTAPLGFESHRTCTEPKDGYMDCTTVVIERGVSCVGSCAKK